MIYLFGELTFSHSLTHVQTNTHIYTHTCAHTHTRTCKLSQQQLGTASSWWSTLDNISNSTHKCRPHTLEGREGGRRRQWGAILRNVNWNNDTASGRQAGLTHVSTTSRHTSTFRTWQAYLTSWQNGSTIHDPWESCANAQHQYW